SVHQAAGAPPGLPLYPLRRPRPRRRLQHGEPDGRAGRPRHRRHHRGRRHLRRLHLCGRQPGDRELPADLLRARGRRGGGLLRRPGRRRPRLPLVQLAPRRGLHGRRRLALPGRRDRRRRRPLQAGDPAGGGRRPVRPRRPLGHHPGGLVQAAGQAGVPHGSAPPPLRALGMGGAQGHRPLLAPGDPLRAHLSLDVEAAMNGSWADRRLERMLVYGLGLSGRAAARLLLARGAAVLAVDDKDVDAGGLAGRIELLPAGTAELLAGIDAVVVSPGVPLNRPLLAEARRRGVPVIAEVELAFPFLNGPVVAITGSNGKSTTTAMTGAMLRAAGLRVEVCGNIGEPLADKGDGPPGRIFVVELSSFQLEGILNFRPQAAALLNLSEDHLDRYGSMDEYGAAKKRLFRDMEPDGIAVLNADDLLASRVATRARQRFFSRLAQVEDGCFAGEDGRVIEVSPGAPDAELFHAADVPL